MLIEFNVALAHALSIFVGDLWHLLSGLVHEVVLYKPLAHKLFRELALCLALLKSLFIAFSVEVAAGVWCVYFVDEIYLAVTLAKLLLGIYKDKATLCCNLLSAGEKTACVVFHHGIVLCADETLGNDLFL